MTPTLLFAGKFFIGESNFVRKWWQSGENQPRSAHRHCHSPPPPSFLPSSLPPSLFHNLLTYSFVWQKEDMADYASLQKLALSDKGQDEAVTVNQRALIGILIPNLLHHLLTPQIKSSPVMLLIIQPYENCCRTQTMQMPLLSKYITWRCPKLLFHLKPSQQPRVNDFKYRIMECRSDQKTGHG